MYILMLLRRQWQQQLNLVTTDKHGNQQLGFALGKAKVAPKHGHILPRLELCAAVLAVELYETCRDELDTRVQTSAVLH